MHLHTEKTLLKVLCVNSYENRFFIISPCLEVTMTIFHYKIQVILPNDRIRIYVAKIPSRMLIVVFAYKLPQQFLMKWNHKLMKIYGTPSIEYQFDMIIYYATRPIAFPLLQEFPTTRLELFRWLIFLLAKWKIV